MGANQSLDQEQAEAKPPDYYELLEIDEEADADEIKRSYRRLAIRYHPDKNPDNVEEATQKFRALQAAYEVLSDPNERAFYDRHRNAPIATTDDDLFEHVSSGDTGKGASKLNKRRPGDPGVRLEQLMRFFDPKFARKMDDTNEGFYSIYRSLFALLASDEALHTPEGQVALTYPSFGDSSTAYAPPSEMTRKERDQQIWVRDFYTVWREFTTEKDFVWVAKWDLERAEDRGTRRLMEKENKRIRDNYRKEYIDAVRQLVNFLHHRDPRYKAYQALQAKAAREKARTKPAPGSGSATPMSTRQPTAAEVAAAQERARAKEKAIEDYEEQDWQRFKASDSEEEEEDGEDEEQKDEIEGDGTAMRMDDGAGGEIFDCLVCNKTFASEATWVNHERSKRHKQAVWRMKKDMQAEDENLPSGGDEAQEGDDDAQQDVASVAEDAIVDDLPSDVEDQLAAIALEEGYPKLSKSKKKKQRAAAPSTPPVDLTERFNTPNAAASAAEGDQITDTRSGSPVQDDAEGESQLSKRDKRRQREAKKKEEEEARKEELKKARKEAKKQGATPPPPIETTRAQNDGFQQVQGRKAGKTTGQKGKGKKSAPEEEVTEEKLQRVLNSIQEKQIKMAEKWGDAWTSLLDTVKQLFNLSGQSYSSPLSVLCLGIGKVYTDRTAQIQLALLMELCQGLGIRSSIEIFDPVFENGDKQVLERLGLEVMTENLKGQHTLDPERQYLLYLPHCSKELYEALLTHNFTPALCGANVRLLLGNDLSEYLPGVKPLPPYMTESAPTDIPQADETPSPSEEGFVKPKKKRKGKDGEQRHVPDGVLRRLVPHMDHVPLARLPETNLPGFARAFLSTSFQWLTPARVDQIDWETPLPVIAFGENSGVF